jgi:hypothetical protein
MNIQDKTITELKAIAFDILIEIERNQKNLQVVNQLIAKKVEEEKAQPAE